MSGIDIKKYFHKDLHWGYSYASRIVFNFLSKAASFCKNGVILDAGAGHQRYKPFFTQSLYLTQEHSAGIEFKGMNSVSYDFINPLDEKIPLKDNSLDGVLSTAVVEHIRYPEKFVREAFRVLKPGGKLFIHAPFVHNEHETPYDFNRPTRYGIEGWFVDAGFEEYDICPVSSSTATVCDLIWLTTSQDIGYGIEKKNKFLGKFLKLIFYIFSKVFCAFARLLVDRGPQSWTNIPSGWVSVATKPGTHIRHEKTPQKEVYLMQFKA